MLVILRLPWKLCNQRRFRLTKIKMEYYYLSLLASNILCNIRVCLKKLTISAQKVSLPPIFGHQVLLNAATKYILCFSIFNIDFE